MCTVALRVPERGARYLLWGLPAPAARTPLKAGIHWLLLRPSCTGPWGSYCDSDCTSTKQAPARGSDKLLAVELQCPG